MQLAPPEVVQHRGPGGLVPGVVGEPQEWPARRSVEATVSNGGGGGSVGASFFGGKPKLSTNHIPGPQGSTTGGVDVARWLRNSRSTALLGMPRARARTASPCEEGRLAGPDSEPMRTRTGAVRRRTAGDSPGPGVCVVEFGHSSRTTAMVVVDDVCAHAHLHYGHPFADRLIPTGPIETDKGQQRLMNVYANPVHPCVVGNETGTHSVRATDPRGP